MLFTQVYHQLRLQHSHRLPLGAVFDAGFRLLFRKYGTLLVEFRPWIL